MSEFQRRWRDQLGTTLENSLRLRKMSDVVFKNERMIDVVTKRGWINSETVEKFVLCEIDAKMRLIERTLPLLGKI
jgi:hypothetical protein